MQVRQKTPRRPGVPVPQHNIPLAGKKPNPLSCLEDVHPKPHHHPRGKKNRPSTHQPEEIPILLDRPQNMGWKNANVMVPLLLMSSGISSRGRVGYGCLGWLGLG